MDSLPPEILRLVLARCNLPVMRLVNQRLNQVASVMLLELRTASLRGAVARLKAKFAERSNYLLDRDRPGVEQVIASTEQLTQVEKEISGLELRVREKQTSVDVLLNTDMPEAQRQQLLRLCDLHSEFVCFSALQAHVAEISRQAEQALRDEQQGRGDMRHPYAGHPDRPLFQQPRRDPALPRGFDPLGEPDPDQFNPPWDGGDDELPDYPGMYGPPGVNDP
jgi:hypothetical protein